MIIPNSDIPVKPPSYTINNNINKYSEEPNISNIIYIQSRFRYYMRKKKKLNKYSKAVLTTKNKTNTILSNSNNVYTKEHSIKKQLLMIKIYQKIKLQQNLKIKMI